MRGAALLCPACGAPLADGFESGAVRCSYCGATKALDSATASSLRRHLWRLRRAEQKALCVLREQIIALLLPDLAGRAKLYLYGGLFVTLVMVPFLAFGGVALVSTDSPVGAIVGIVLIGLGTILVTVGFPLGFYMAFREGKNADKAASRAARVAGALADTSVAARCTQCGGFADVVVIGSSATSPCPWCGAALYAQGVDAERVAADTILRAKQQTADEALKRARARIGSARRRSARLQLPGYELRGGVYEGRPQGIPAWIGFEVMEAGIQRRLDMECDLPLQGAVWFVRRALAPLHAQVVAESRQTYPGPAVATDAELDPYFIAYAESGTNPSALAHVPAVRALLGRLSNAESLHLDPAGASIWNLGGSIFGAQHRDVVPQAEALAMTLAEISRGAYR